MYQPSDEKQPNSLLGPAATVKWFACVVDPGALSHLEQAIVSRYIHAGEFAYLCLFWPWTGERDDLRVIQLDDNRGVVLEQLSDTEGSKGPLLLSKLCELGLRPELEQL